MTSPEQIAVAILAPLLFSVAGLYLWAVICFLFFRYSRAETEERLRDFLQQRQNFYTYRSGSKSPPVITPRFLRKTGSRGWLFLGLPAINLLYGFSYQSVLIGTALLFFGGLIFAYSWYGLRCLRLLGLESYVTQDD